MKEYARGFEDAIELALKEIDKARNLSDARLKILYLLSLVKEKKYEAIHDELGILM